MKSGRAAAPVMGGIRWMVLAILSWEVVQWVRELAPASTGSWPINPVEIALLTIVPAFVAFAFVRLFLACLQAGYGSLNTYTLTASPWAWAFWLGLAVAMVGHGTHLTANALNESLPEVVRHGEYATQVEFLDEQLGHWLLGGGFLMVTAVVTAMGQGAAQRVYGGERWVLAAASVVTFGFTVVFIGVEGQQLVPAILGCGLLVGLALRALPPREMSYDPVSLAIMPGVTLAGLVLLAWGLLVGGQPSWPW